MNPLFRTTLFSRRGLIAWAVLIVGLLLTMLVWSSLREERRRNADSQFEFHTREVVAAIEKRLRDHEQILLGGAGLYDANTEVDRAQWRAYVQRLRLKENYPGIQGVGFSEAIPPAGLAAHQAKVRASGFPDYAVKPPGVRPLYTSIIYLEPFTGRNLAAFGYDMFSQPTRRRAMQLAVDSNATAITGKVRLVQETHGNEQAGFLMYVPVYGSGMPLDTAEARWRALRGYVYSPYRADDLMHGILGESNHVIDFTLHDGQQPTSDTLMYDSAQARATLPGHPASYSATRRIEAYGQTWTMNLRSRPAFDAQFASALDWLVPSLGIGISLSLFGLTLSLLGRREQAIALAGEMMCRQTESEERFRQLFLHLGQGVLIHQHDGHILDANPAAERILGLNLAQMRGLASLDTGWRTIREDGSEFPASEWPVVVALRNGQPVTDVTMGVWHEEESRWRWLKVDAYLRNEAIGSQAQRVYAVFSDITDERTANLEARQTRKFLSDVLAAASEVSIIATDVNGLITIFNAGAERLLGYRADEMVGKQTPALLHLPEEALARGNTLSAEFGFAITGFRIFVEKPEREGSEIREWTYVRKDGHLIPVSLVVTTMRDATGTVTGYVGIAEDITQRKQVELALREQAQHTQAILDHMVDGIVTIDETGMIDSFNPAAEHIFGYKADAVVGRNIRMLMPDSRRGSENPTLRNNLAIRVARIIGSGREVQGQRRDGSLFPLELAVSKITRQGKPMYVGMARDITERKRVERMKSEFVSTVSHELRTPLTSISGALGLVSGGALGALPEQAQEMIAIAFKNSKRLTYLINDLLDMEKLAAGKMHFDMQVQPLMPLLTQSLDANLAYGSERRVTLELTNQGADIEVRVDSQRLMQVLSNLLSNAIKYSPEEGVVEVATTLRGAAVRVTVTDHGPGIPAAFRDRIFQKFAQADASDTRQKGGTGLGLAITRELVERMGGKIDFESTEGAGARFFFELPLLSPDTAYAALASGPQADAMPRILVVEDEPDVARLLALMLTRAGYSVDIAVTGTDALNAIQRTHYAAVTLDLMLPDISGLGIIHRLRQHPQTAGLPIVVVSAKVEDGRLALKGDFSHIDWLAKPINESRLLSIVEGLAASANRKPPRVLHIEDDTDLHQVVRAMVGNRVSFSLATTLRAARASLAVGHFDVVILDLNLPDGQGWDLLPEIRAQHPEARVVILSGTDMAADEIPQVEMVLSKSHISPQQLLDAISIRIRPAPESGNPS